MCTGTPHEQLIAVVLPVPNTGSKHVDAMSTPLLVAQPQPEATPPLAHTIPQGPVTVTLADTRINPHKDRREYQFYVMAGNVVMFKMPWASFSELRAKLIWFESNQNMFPTRGFLENYKSDQKNVSRRIFALESFIQTALRKEIRNPRFYSALGLGSKNKDAARLSKILPLVADGMKAQHRQHRNLEQYKRQEFRDNKPRKQKPQETTSSLTRCDPMTAGVVASLFEFVFG